MAAPGAPSIKARNLSVGTIRVQWAPDEDAGDYTVYRDETQLATTELADTALTHYDDNAILSETVYHYRVKANNDDGSSAYSNEVAIQASSPTGENDPSPALKIARTF